MKQFKLLPVVVAVVLVVAVSSCSPVRYDVGYETGVYQAAPYYGADPYNTYYYSQAPYYSTQVYGRNYNGRSYGPGREARERRDDDRRQPENRREVTDRRDDSRGHSENRREFRNNQTPQQHQPEVENRQQRSASPQGSVQQRKSDVQKYFFNRGNDKH